MRIALAALNANSSRLKVSFSQKKVFKMAQVEFIQLFSFRCVAFR